MKHTKIFFALLAFAAAILGFGCNQANGKPTPTFTMNEQQKTGYNTFIASLGAGAAAVNVPADVVKKTLDSASPSFAALNFKVTDNNAGNAIPKRTKADALKKRFVPSAK